MDHRSKCFEHLHESPRKSKFSAVLKLESDLNGIMNPLARSDTETKENISSNIRKHSLILPTIRDKLHSTTSIRKHSLILPTIRNQLEKSLVEKTTAIDSNHQSLEDRIQE